MKQTHTLPAVLPNLPSSQYEALKAAKLVIMGSGAPVFYKSDCHQRLKWVVQGILEGDLDMAADCWVDFVELASKL